VTTSAQWQRITALFDEARALPPTERLAFVTNASPDDAVVRDEVLSLLAADTDENFLDGGARVQPADLLDAAGGHDWRPGEQLGPYRIERLLARGGMGVLYVATDTRLARHVTLKVLPASAARDVRARSRLQREARLAASLRHPHVVSVHALEQIGSTLVIVAEYVEGPTLAEVLRERGPLPRGEWLDLAKALASALAAAHAAQVVHRDVKTSNIVMGRDGVRLVDFGIAAGGHDEAARVTQAGQMSGTPLALAPEQLEGVPASPASDQFAFGVVLYEAASGRLPFGEGPIAAVWRRLARGDLTPLPAVAPHLDPDVAALVHRCLAHRPEDRFASMQHVAEALRDGMPTAAAPSVSLSSHDRRSWMARHHAITALLYIGMLWPGWLVAAALPGRWRATAHLALVGLAAVATSLRLHLWFSGRHYPETIARRRRRLWPVLTGIDVAYAATLGLVGWVSADARLVPAVVSVGLAVCLWVASVVIEPATRRAFDDLP